MELNITADSEEDLLFEDIQRQISLLMIEEEEGIEPKSTISNNPSPFPLQLSSSQCWTYNHSPVWPVNAPGSSPLITSNQPSVDLKVCPWRFGRRESNGTGVFIPRFNGLRRKSRAGKSNNLGVSFQDKLYKQVENS